MIAASIQAVSVQPGRAPVKVRDFHVADGAAWDEFVRSQREGSPFHVVAWLRAVESFFGYEPRHLCAEQEGCISGVLPLFLISNVMMGRCLISIPSPTTAEHALQTTSRETL